MSPENPYDDPLSSKKFFEEALLTLPSTFSWHSERAIFAGEASCYPWRWRGPEDWGVGVQAALPKKMNLTIPEGKKSVMKNPKPGELLWRDPRSPGIWTVQELGNPVPMSLESLPIGNP